MQEREQEGTKLHAVQVEPAATEMLAQAVT